MSTIVFIFLQLIFPWLLERYFETSQKLVALLERGGYDLNDASTTTGILGFLPIHSAARGADEDKAVAAVELLIRYGADANLPETNGPREVRHVSHARVLYVHSPRV